MMQMLKIIIPVIVLVLLNSCVSPEKEFEKAKNVNTVEGYRVFIGEFPDSEFVDSAINQIADIKFRKAVKINSEESYQFIIDSFPNSIVFDSAIVKIEILKREDIDTLMSICKLENYLDFVRNIDLGIDTIIYFSKLDSLRFDSVKQIGTNAVFRQFVKDYPNSNHINEAKTSITKYEISGRITNISQLKKYFTSSTNVQLVSLPYPSDHESEMFYSFEIESNSHGGLIFKPKNTKSKVNSDGSFLIRTNKKLNGKFIIAIQNLDFNQRKLFNMKGELYVKTNDLKKRCNGFVSFSSTIITILYTGSHNVLMIDYPSELSEISYPGLLGYSINGKYSIYPASKSGGLITF